MPTYPGDPVYQKAVARSRAAGEPAEVATLTLGSHCGTHVDVPFHIIADGADLSAAPLDAFVGPCVVVELSGRRAIDTEDVVAAVPAGAQRVLFKTDNSALWTRNDFVPEYTYITAAAAGALAASGVRLVGIDYLSVEAFGAVEPAAHRTLLAAGVMVLEGLDLGGVAAGGYFLIALPLAIESGDGSPVRAVLVEDVYGEKAT